MRCSKCGMEFVPDYPEDAKAHRKYHDKIVNGFYARKIKSDRIVWEKGDYRITVVHYFSPLAQKKRAEEAGLLAHKDTPWDFAPYHSKECLDERNVHIFRNLAKFLATFSFFSLSDGHLSENFLF